MFRLVFEVYDLGLWELQRGLIVRAFECDRDDGYRLSVKLLSGRIEHYNPVRNITVQEVKPHD